MPAGHIKTRIAFCWTKKEKKDRYSMKYIWPSVWKPKNESSCLQEHLRKRHSKDLSVWIFCLPMWPDTNLNMWQIIWVQVKHSKLSWLSRKQAAFSSVPSNIKSIGSWNAQAFWDHTQKGEQCYKPVRTSHYCIFFISGTKLFYELKQKTLIY